MLNLIEIIKTIILGIIEGVTEWLPISSTGHLILVNEIIQLDVSAKFQEMFNVVIQLGAIMAVVLLFFYKIKPFFKNHDPPRPNRHGNDVGTQYRSAIWVTTPRQAEVASLLRGAWVAELERAVPGARCYTTIGEAGACFAQSGGPFYLAEDYHQAYLEKNPDGYCNHGPNGVSCPVGILNMPAQVNVERPR